MSKDRDAFLKVPKWQEFVKADDNKIIYQCDRTIMVYDKRTKKKKRNWLRSRIMKSGF